ncbi:hypothetical protein HYS31_05880 [Candidatus Woesearchaeota archaeon]|nr:hypothetical protein [Candidatus Woesearchaeota archaeon]
MHYHNTTLKAASSYIYKYPKFLLLFITFLIAYLLFNGRTNPEFHVFIISLGFFGTFLAGILFTYGFTAAPATAIFLIIAKEQNILLAGLIGGLGALLGDLFIFNFIRSSFRNEVKKLHREKLVMYISHKTPSLIKRYLLPAVAGFIIASPLPDEIGVTMLAASKSISAKVFSVISYVLNTMGIFIVLLIGKSL